MRTSSRRLRELAELAVTRPTSDPAELRHVMSGETG